MLAQTSSTGFVLFKLAETAGHDLKLKEDTDDKDQCLQTKCLVQIV
jgi:hypothetical protein